MASQNLLPLSILPMECVEEIMAYLDLDTIKALRLSSRDLYLTCTGRRFKSFLRCHTIEMTKAAFHSSRQWGMHPQLSDAVKSLRIMTTIYDQTKLLKPVDERDVTPSAGSQSQSSKNPNDLAWLQQQQKLQDEVSYQEAVEHITFYLHHFRALECIQLDAVLVRGPGKFISTSESKNKWCSVWMRASQTYCMTMEAIARSGIAPKTLDIYGETIRCSVPMYDIAINLDQISSANVKKAGRCIENLALSVSTKVDTGATEQPLRPPLACHDLQTVNAGHTNMMADIKYERFDGIARLLEVTPNLKSLDIHFYNTLLRKSTGYQSMFDMIAKHTRLPLLRVCKLRCLATSKDSLLRFFSNHHRIYDLALEHISLGAEDAWESLFSQLVEVLPNLERLHLSNLRDRRSVLNLHPTWEEKPPRAPG
ncbi:hypothetical protein N7492_006213 [Penicillium capsulatum]|uniref:F-box domain-containing protein n=1 Tax=Penicillium capsulatum TaxID=69766 RepID=A0A9W9I6H9_9EURO|nr:hypothetical protein N7492_006213 [Penicillium capsulatum]